ncbi:hypothetical protein, partial [Burkholderia pseudomallei]
PAGVATPAGAYAATFAPMPRSLARTPNPAMRLSANQASACTIGASCRAKTGTVERWDIERGSPCIGKPRDIRREIGGRRCNP